MKNYTINSDGMSSVNAEQIENNSGVQYRASGNLFIARQSSKTVPKAYSGNRGSITGFSAGSGLRMRRYLRECRSKYTHMVTLTYPYEFPTNGAESKNHLRRFLQELQREWKRDIDWQGVRQLHSSFWFLEFQERGAPHYHIFTNWPISKKWVSSRWYDIVGSEDIRHLHAGTRTERLLTGRAGTISYASKYANKLVQKVVPAGFENVGRFWGVYGERVTMSAATFVSRADAEKLNVSRVVEHMLNGVKKAVDAGIAEVVKREEGILIVVCHDEKVMQKIRMSVSRVTALTMKWYDLFVDADVEYGIIYDDEGLLYKAQ